MSGLFKGRIVFTYSTTAQCSLSHRQTKFSILALNEESGIGDLNPGKNTAYKAAALDQLS